MDTKINGLSVISTSYDAIFCDIFGVLHNGCIKYKDAVSALLRFRNEGGKVVLMTNSPKTVPHVIEQLRILDIEDQVYDDIVTSGEVTRNLICKGSVFHLGPERDISLFDTLDVDRETVDKAQKIVCTGLFNEDHETPDQYEEMLLDLLDRGLPMICANPDIAVERGDRLVWCAGSLAQMYKKMGGLVMFAGKPNQCIYKLAMSKLGIIHSQLSDKTRILAVGDGILTDIFGAQSAELNSLFISSGIHASEYGGKCPDSKMLRAFLSSYNLDSVTWMPYLRW
ncbi:TIGR01459 family HAD-type hydrolase [Candidatus Endowatersipora endosymbiont of Watersipora subatra]|uniref:TIGR01459 family HAD-type hydrolase n=1 Tax=Candidatus Endowatersipora endosymbiont of Watersipora subatra TaxID=3077946 RepID=UPI00312C9F62